jgi:hypothetical protein
MTMTRPIAHVVLQGLFLTSCALWLWFVATPVDGSDLWSGVPKFAAASLVSASAALMGHVMSIGDEGRFSVARLIAAVSLVPVLLVVGMMVLAALRH